MNKMYINLFKRYSVMLLVCFFLASVPQAQASRIWQSKFAQWSYKPYANSLLNRNFARYFSSTLGSSYFVPPERLLRVGSQYLNNPINVYAATFKDVQPYMYSFNQQKLINVMTDKLLDTKGMRNTSAASTDIQGAGLFVIGSKGEFYVGAVPHHDYFTQGREDLSGVDKNVAFAGSIHAVDGTAKCIWMDSGHYKCGAPVDKEDLIRPDITLRNDGSVISMEMGIWDPKENYFHLAEAAEYIMAQQRSDLFYVGFFGGENIYLARDFIKSFRCRGKLHDLQPFNAGTIGVRCSSWVMP